MVAMVASFEVPPNVSLSQVKRERYAPGGWRLPASASKLAMRVRAPRNVLLPSNVAGVRIALAPPLHGSRRAGLAGTGCEAEAHGVLKGELVEGGRDRQEYVHGIKTYREHLL
ncbi:hypothetical protein BDN71DRAFT_1594546 [Pleurotus eryngii]|uniref:Uncharacterized protein n=1 Tax=Pleurotus eryngii TaxID=5323 RepID=A0A9P5ZH43_PLEER|nr:hypothetical protein BDN71DRAFT_1594546 [Pleurotus eryngii]